MIEDVLKPLKKAITEKFKEQNETCKAQLPPEKEDEKGKMKEVELYLKKHKITEINNTITIIVDEEPIEVGVDPYNKLIDTNSNDNRRRL